MNEWINEQWWMNEWMNEWMSDLEKEDLVLLLEREGEPIDDWAEDLQELGHPVVPLRLVDEVVEDVVDLLSEKKRKFLSESW
jgi:hypothetical protein